MGAKRKQDIYDICVEFGKSSPLPNATADSRFSVDVIIVEDDPYYFLQEGDYKPKAGRHYGNVKHDAEKFLASLAPSYLKFDYQGRVVRLDTFSKVGMVYHYQLGTDRFL